MNNVDIIAIFAIKKSCKTKCLAGRDDLFPRYHPHWRISYDKTPALLMKFISDGMRYLSFYLLERRFQSETPYSCQAFR